MKLIGSSKEAGATFVEFALVCPLYFFVIFGLIDLLYMSYTSLGMQFIATQAIREISLGELSVDEALAKFTQQAGRIGISLAPDCMHVCPVSQYPCTANQLGASSELFVLKLEVPLDGIIMGPALRALGLQYRGLSTAVLGKMEPR